MISEEDRLESATTRLTSKVFEMDIVYVRNSSPVSLRFHLMHRLFRRGCNVDFFASHVVAHAHEATLVLRTVTVEVLISRTINVHVGRFSIDDRICENALGERSFVTRRQTHPKLIVNEDHILQLHLLGYEVILDARLRNLVGSEVAAGVALRGMVRFDGVGIDYRTRSLYRMSRVIEEFLLCLNCCICRVTIVAWCREASIVTPGHDRVCHGSFVARTANVGQRLGAVSKTGQNVFCHVVD